MILLLSKIIIRIILVSIVQSWYCHVFVEQESGNPKMNNVLKLILSFQIIRVVIAYILAVLNFAIFSASPSLLLDTLILPVISSAAMWHHQWPRKTVNWHSHKSVKWHYWTNSLLDFRLIISHLCELKFCNKIGVLMLVIFWFKHQKRWGWGVGVIMLSNELTSPSFKTDASKRIQMLAVPILSEVSCPVQGQTVLVPDWIREDWQPTN